MKVQNIELKAVKTKKGHEGELLMSANIYHQNKKIGIYSESDWGGPTQFEANEEVVNKLSEVYKDYQFSDEEFIPLENEDRAEYVIADIMVFKDWENEFKKIVKKHGEKYGIVVFVYYNSMSSIKYDQTFLTKKEEDYSFNEEEIQKVLENFKTKNIINPPKYYRVLNFKDLGDFEMNLLTDRTVKAGELI